MRANRRISAMGGLLVRVSGAAVACMVAGRADGRQAACPPRRARLGSSQGFSRRAWAMTARAAMAFLVAFLVAFPAAGLARAADDEPEYLGIKLSAWVKRLHEGKTPKERKGG